MTTRQKKTLGALLNAPTMRAAASSAGISYATLRRWIREDAEFREAYNTELSALVENAANQARQGMTEAIEVLREITTDMFTSQSVRVAACKVLLESGSRFIEMQSYETRIAELERMISENERH